MGHVDKYFELSNKRQDCAVTGQVRSGYKGRSQSRGATLDQCQCQITVISWATVSQMSDSHG